ncbi:peptidyl-prolyl cis-trans isomerase FKBP2 [Biomphalaria glabrata]|uniref:peptidylprolyl isomerase n=1 Tax=Biomphalaria glabrata TaxID=6526 RepID=A0A9W2ZV55_BIOGL|nr:peptidyl-prolyl cis-trans isomerase FKBP2-like [Biomphalaria glabrata]KAI8785340.1 peptidyl-prolyl cis-trans isomerase FKBP2 [Biomphalaria glabrata]
MHLAASILPIISIIFVIVLFSSVESSADKDKKLQIGIKKRVDPEKCKLKSRKGDVLHMHYTGKLEDGTEFDSSLTRNQPFVFTLGTGQVIKGWDQGLLNMCEEEKRKLVIPSDMGYGERGAPPKIPGGATLVFEVELLKIERKDEL